MGKPEGHSQNVSRLMETTFPRADQGSGQTESKRRGGGGETGTRG